MTRLAFLLSSLVIIAVAFVVALLPQFNPHRRTP